MTTSVPMIMKYLHLNNNYLADQNIDMPQKQKKRRLDHLTWEEKLQRKKLKNRVAAQTSRDRKKAKMEQMESALQELFAKNEAVMEECKKLREMNERLMAENASLTQRLSASQPTLDQSRPVELAAADNGLATFALQPRGAVAGSAATLDARDSGRLGALMALAAACLLYRTCSTSSRARSTSTRSNSSRRCCSRISPEIWRELLKRQLIRNQSTIQTLENWWGRHQKAWNPMEVVI